MPDIRFLKAYSSKEPSAEINIQQRSDLLKDADKSKRKLEKKLVHHMLLFVRQKIRQLDEEYLTLVNVQARLNAKQKYEERVNKLKSLKLATSQEKHLDALKISSSLHSQQNELLTQEDIEKVNKTQIQLHQILKGYEEEEEDDTDSD